MSIHGTHPQFSKTALMPKQTAEAEQICYLGVVNKESDPPRYIYGSLSFPILPWNRFYSKFDKEVYRQLRFAIEWFPCSQRRENIFRRYPSKVLELAMRNLDDKGKYCRFFATCIFKNINLALGWDANFKIQIKTYCCDKKGVILIYRDDFLLVACLVLASEKVMCVYRFQNNQWLDLSTSFKIFTCTVRKKKMLMETDFQM